MNKEKMRVEMYVSNNWGSPDMKNIIMKNEERRNKPFSKIGRYYFNDGLTVNQISEITNYSNTYVRQIIEDIECIVYNRFDL